MSTPLPQGRFLYSRKPRVCQFFKNIGASLCLLTHGCNFTLRSYHGGRYNNQLCSDLFFFLIVCSSRLSAPKRAGTVLIFFTSAFLVPGIWKVFCNYLLSVMEKEMAPHSSTLAWKIPWTEERSRLQSMGSQRVGHD